MVNQRQRSFYRIVSQCVCLKRNSEGNKKMNLGKAVGLTAVLIGLIMGGPALANDFHGAMAYDAKTGAHGWASDYTSKKKAQNRALKECWVYGNECEVVATVTNACVALARRGSSEPVSAWAEAPDLASAETSALSDCKSKANGKDCELVSKFCALAP